MKGKNIYQGPAREKQVGENSHPSVQCILHLPVCKHEYLKVYVRVWAISLSTLFTFEKIQHLAFNKVLHQKQLF